MPAKKSTRGGAGRGQGRKPAQGEAQVTGSIAMPPAAWHEFDKRRGKKSRGAELQRLMSLEQPTKR